MTSLEQKIFLVSFFSIILIFSFEGQLVFAEDETFSFYLDKVWYQPRDNIQISGWINTLTESKILIEIINPENLVIQTQNITLEKQEIDQIIPAFGAEWDTPGFYQAKITFGNEIQTRYFAFGNFDPFEFEPQISVDKESYSWTDTVKITVLSPIDNQYNNQIDEIQLDISTRSGKLSSYVLEETGPSHGIFEGVVFLTGHPDYDVDGDGRDGDARGITQGKGPDEGHLSAHPNDQIILRFSSDFYAEVIEKIIPVKFQIAEIFWPDEIEPDSQVRVRVFDPDMSLIQDFRDQVKVLVGLSEKHFLKEFTLSETGNNNGVFEGLVKFSDNISDDGIVISPGNTVFLKYEDRTLPPSYATSSLEIIAESKVIGIDKTTPKTDFSNFNKDECLSQRDSFQKNDTDLYLVNHWPIKGEWFVEGYGDMNTTILGDVVNLSDVPLTEIKISVQTFRGGHLLEEETSWHPIKKILRPDEVSPFVITPNLSGFDNYKIWINDYKPSCEGIAIPESTIESIRIDNNGQTLEISCNPTLPTRDIGKQHLLFVTYSKDYFIDSIEIGPFFFLDSYECFGKGSVDITPYVEYFKENRLEVFVIEGPKTLIFSERDIRIQTLIQTNVYSNYYPDSLYPSHMNLDKIRSMAQKGNPIQTPTITPEEITGEQMAIESLIYQGLLSLEAGNYWDAVSWFDNALVHDPNNIEALYHKGLAFEALGLDKDAQVLFEKVEHLKSPIEIPQWIRGNAGWWSQELIKDSDFILGIQYLIKEGIMTIPETKQVAGLNDSKEIPEWIKNNADWWSKGLITDDDFVKGIQYLIEQGIILI